MHNKKINQLLIGAMLAAMAPAVSAADIPAWNGSALGFEAGQQGLLGDMLGIRPILEENGFHYNLGYLNEMAYNAGGGYDHDKHLAYIDQVSLTFTQDLERWTGIPDARLEGNIVNRNHDDNLTTKRLQDPRVSFNDLSQESWGGGSITRLGWLTFARSFDDRRLTLRIGMMNKVQTFDQIIPCDFQLLTQCGGKSANSLTWNNWNIHTWGTTLEYKLTPTVTLKGGVMEQNPQATARSHAWSWSTKGSKGILLPMEIETRPLINGLPGAYNLGVVWTNAPQSDLYSGKSGGAGATDPQGYAEHDSTWFMYAGLNQQITRHADDPLRGMSVSLSGSLSDQRSNYIHSAVAASMRYRGLFDARPDGASTAGPAAAPARRPGGSDNRAHRSANDRPPAGKPDRYSRWRRLSDSYSADYVRSGCSCRSTSGRSQSSPPGGVAQTQDAWVAEWKTVVTF